jgi:sec-independent protein translocase protein TatC
MFLTPPDVISQTLLAVPIYVLFEAGILMSRLMLNSKTDRDIAGDEPA